MQDDTGVLGFFELFNRGGWVMYAILAVSIYAAGIILYKALQFASLRLSKDDFSDALIGQYAGPQSASMMLPRLKTIGHPLARVMEAGLLAASHSVAPEVVREEVARVGAQQIHKMEAHVRGLELAATLAPLMGLLGMVLSMIHVFSSIQSAGARVDAGLLAGGIWEALLTTAFGLIVAIPAQGAFFYFDQKIENVRQRINDVGIRWLQLIAPETNEQAAARPQLKMA